MPNPDFVLAPVKTRFSVAEEPALNVFSSLSMLIKPDRFSDSGPWVDEGMKALGSELLHAHMVVWSGLHYVVSPIRSHSSFPAYIEDIASTDAITLRDRCLDAYFQKCANMPEAEQIPLPEHPIDMLDSLDGFLDFLTAGFGEEVVDREIETEAYYLLLDPPRMKDVVVSHMNTIWNVFMEKEWARVEPLVRSSVDAFSQISFSGMSAEEALEIVVGEPGQHEKLVKMLDRTEEQVVFVPSAHVGPYLSHIWGEDTLWIFFGARAPEGVQHHSQALDIAEIKVRLNALSDDTRLQILALVAEHGELCSTELMEMLDLTQSTAQRHLNLLTATGYLVARRHEGAKCFTLKVERIDQTFQALKELVRS